MKRLLKAIFKHRFAAFSFWMCVNILIKHHYSNSLVMICLSDTVNYFDTTYFKSDKRYKETLHNNNIQDKL